MTIPAPPMVTGPVRRVDVTLMWNVGVSEVLPLFRVNTLDACVSQCQGC